MCLADIRLTVLWWHRNTEANQTCHQYNEIAGGLKSTGWTDEYQWSPKINLRSLLLKISHCDHLRKYTENRARSYKKVSCKGLGIVIISNDPERTGAIRWLVFRASRSFGCSESISQLDWTYVPDITPGLFCTAFRSWDATKNSLFRKWDGYARTSPMGREKKSLGSF